jgi:hypothetical protein
VSGSEEAFAARAVCGTASGRSPGGEAAVPSSSPEHPISPQGLASDMSVVVAVLLRAGGGEVSRRDRHETPSRANDPG